jgi:sigma-B regulation protein RsbU (phosphoserine phosphatase)
MMAALFLVQVTVATVRDMLRADALALALGTGLAAAGLVALVVSGLTRRRFAAPMWLGVFALLYGMRLLIRTDTFRVAAGGSPAVWDYAEAAITYVVPIPLLLFSPVVAPEWRALTNRFAIGVTVFASAAIAADAWLRRPYSAQWPNNLIAVTLMVVLVAWAFRRGQAKTRELPPSREALRRDLAEDLAAAGGAVRIGVASFALTAFVDNVRGVGLIQFPRFDLEPLGVIVTVACLATLVAWRALGDARRLVAIERELSIAREIQASILPQAMPRAKGVTVAARYRPMTAVAGDFYDFLEPGGDRIGVLVADVTGHGVPAALIASMVKVALSSQHDRVDRPSEVLAGINRALSGRLGGRYVTAAYLFIDARAGMMRYAAAGHPPMLHVTRQGVRRLEENGILLGFLPDAVYPETELRLSQDGDDRFLLYTDGLIEAGNRADDLFEIDGVERALAASSGLPPDAAADSVLSAMDAWSGLAPTDDLTLVLVDRSA